MAEAKHTPGPWVIQENTGMDEAWCDWHNVGPISLMGGKADANSRLIAAAPDLLDALKMARVWLDFDGRYDLQGIDAVIAKAEGRLT